MPTVAYLAVSGTEVLVTSALFYAFFKFIADTVLSESNAARWGVRQEVRLDIACKFVSSAFAAFATVSGLMLITSGERTNSDIDHVLLVASGYFIYDVGAMFRSRVKSKRNALCNNYNSCSVEISAITSSMRSLGITNYRAFDNWSREDCVLPYIFSMLIVCAHLFSLYFTLDLSANRVYENERHIASPAASSDFYLFLSFLRDQPLMMAHHLVIALFFIPLMMSQLADHEPGDLIIACALIFEASTPFVSARAILSHLDMKSSTLYLVNGFLMVGMFFCCRYGL
jgi:hypothetical protein